MLGRGGSDPLFLQVKEAEELVLSRFAGASKYANQGQPVVAGQRLMQASSDIFLGWQRTDAGLGGQAGDFYVRQLRDWKFSLGIETMQPSDMRMYGELCAWKLARAHARSGDRIAIAAYLGGSDVFDRAITKFAAAYAGQNERDHDALVRTVASGRIKAELRPVITRRLGRCCASTARTCVTRRRAAGARRGSRDPLALMELPLAPGPACRPAAASMSLTTRLKRSFATRVDQLDPDARTVLLVAALQDSGIVAETLTAAAELTGDQRGLAGIDAAASAAC